MGMNGYKNAKSGKIKFLRDFNGYHNVIYKKDEVHEKLFWPDDKDKNVIWWNEGQGSWNSNRIGQDIEILDSWNDPL